MKVVELGCGPRKTAGRIGIDRLDLPGVDIVADLNKGLPFFDDNSIDAIHSTSFLEHIIDLELLMKDIWRVLKPGGKNHLFVPHFSNPYYYSDYTHSRFFGLYSFEYFSKAQKRYRRKVPNFYNDFGFHTVYLQLYFSSRCKVMKPVKGLANLLFNSSPLMQEIYEENFTGLLPCYGIAAVLVPDK